MEGEQALHSSSFKWVILRPTAVYGPGDKALTPLLKMVAKGICPNIFKASQKLSVLHVDDLALDVLEIVQNFEKYLLEKSKSMMAKSTDISGAKLGRL